MMMSSNTLKTDSVEELIRKKEEQETIVSATPTYIVDATPTDIVEATPTGKSNAWVTVVRASSPLVTRMRKHFHAKKSFCCAKVCVLMMTISLVFGAFAMFAAAAFAASAMKHGNSSGIPEDMVDIVQHAMRTLIWIGVTIVSLCVAVWVVACKKSAAKPAAKCARHSKVVYGLFAALLVFIFGMNVAALSGSKYLRDLDGADLTRMADECDHHDWNYTTTDLYSACCVENSTALPDDVSDIVLGGQPPAGNNTSFLRFDARETTKHGEWNGDEDQDHKTFIEMVCGAIQNDFNNNDDEDHDNDNDDSRHHHHGHGHGHGEQQQQESTARPVPVPSSSTPSEVDDALECSSYDEFMNAVAALLHQVAHSLAVHGGLGVAASLLAFVATCRLMCGSEEAGGCARNKKVVAALYKPTATELSQLV